MIIDKYIIIILLFILDILIFITMSRSSKGSNPDSILSLFKKNKCIDSHKDSNTVIAKKQIQNISYNIKQFWM